jgi:hypothetical protein
VPSRRRNEVEKSSPPAWYQPSKVSSEDLLSSADPPTQQPQPSEPQRRTSTSESPQEGRGEGSRIVVRGPRTAPSIGQGWRPRASPLSARKRAWLSPEALPPHAPTHGASRPCRRRRRQLQIRRRPTPRPRQVQASHAATTARQPHAWVPTPQTSYDHASAQAPPQQPQGHPPKPATGRSGGRRPAPQIRADSPQIRPTQRRSRRRPPHRRRRRVEVPPPPIRSTAQAHRRTTPNTTPAHARDQPVDASEGWHAEAANPTRTRFQTSTRGAAPCPGGARQHLLRACDPRPAACPPAARTPIQDPQRPDVPYERRAHCRQDAAEAEPRRRRVAAPHTPLPPPGTRLDPGRRDQTREKSPRRHLPWGRADIRRRPLVTARWDGVEGGGGGARVSAARVVS